jgi:hypothetical protein
MSHAALVNGTLFWLVVLLTLLLVLFLCAVVVARLEDDVPAGAPSPESLTVVPVARTPPAPASALPARQPQALAPPADGAGEHGGADYAARHTPAAPVILPPTVHGGPRRRPVSALLLVIAGLAIAVIGGWLLLRIPSGAVPCSRQVAAICSDGSVMLTGTQVLGGALVLAGIALFFTALYLALR